MQEASFMGDNIEAPIDLQDNEKDATGVSEVTSKKKRPYKAVSDVWEHFVKKGDGGKATHCNCKYCKKELACSSAQGTSSLWRHLTKCPKCPKNQDPKQSLLSFNSSDGQGIKNWKFDQEALRTAIDEMIIYHELPFNFVEHKFFRKVMMLACPKYRCVSRTTVTKDCQDMYKKAKIKLKNSLMECSRVSLTTDLWTSIQNVGYMCLTAHFIDKEWKLQKRIINFKQLPSPHTGEVIGHAIEICLLDWGIEKLCTITVDNATSNDLAVKNLQRKFVKKEGLLLDGELFHVRCAAHIMNLIVKDGMDEVKDSISKIRDCVKYVRGSPSRLQAFKKCIEEERITCRKYCPLDCTTRWNSTYTMLDSAIPFQKAFDRLGEQDLHLKYELGGPPNEDDWNVAKGLCQFLKTFYEATNQLSGSTYVTANIYFHQIMGMEHMLREWTCSHDSRFRDMALKMKRKYDKYWGSIDKMNMLLIVSVILDPCFKLDYVGFWFKKLAGEDGGSEILMKVRSLLDRLFEQYKKLDPISTGPTGDPTPSNIDVNPNKLVDFATLARQTYLQEKQTTTQTMGKSELEAYLEDRVEEAVDGFDILGW